MNSALIERKTGFAPVASWVSGATVCLGVLFGASTALAAPPPANTIIGNQASATYSDSGGNAQLATSNIVQTLVQQVGSFDLDGKTTITQDVVNTKTGAAGATVYAPHVLTNTGNGSDKFDITVDAAAGGFSKVEVFADVNGDGVPDSTTALCTATPAATCTVPAQTVAGNNGKFQFVVAYSLPSTATTPTDPYSYGTVTATVVTSDVPYTNTSAADRDHVNLTTLAAFNLTKAIGIPAVAAPGGGAWLKAAASGQRSSSDSCPTAWTPGLASDASCQYTVYTLNVSNTGGAKGKFVLQDTLPSGFTYVTGSAVWSSAPGTALDDGAGGDPAGIDYQVSGQTITAVVDAIGPNVSQTISFVVLVNNTAEIGTSTTTNTAQYNPTDAPGATAATPGDVKSPSNPAPFTVLGTYSFAIGTNPSTATTAKDATAGKADGTADTTTVASAVAGSSVSFPNTVFNMGNAADTINLAMGASTQAFPPGTTFAFFAADGVTPLLDSTGDGIPDTGPIPAGGSVNIVVRATLPTTATVGTGPFDILVVGTSAGDPSVVVDATKEVLTAVIGSLVDLTNSAAGKGSGMVADGDLGPGPSPLPTTTNETQAGQGTIFTLYVKNNDTKDNTYKLAASQSPNFPGTLPAGWTVKFVAAGATCTGAALTSVPVSAGGQEQVDACVTPPATQAPVVAQKIYFQVQSTAPASNGTIVSDAKTDAVTVKAALTYGATLTPSNTGQVGPGGTVVYPHTLTNTGSQICKGPYTLTAQLPAGDVAAGWTTALYIDVNGNGVIDEGDTLVTGPIPGPLEVDKPQKLLVKVFAPGGAQAGTTDTATVTVTFPTGDDSCGAPSATDISTVIAGQVRVIKTQAADPDCTGQVDEAAFSAAQLQLKPGQCVVYRVVATNEGTASVINLMINDNAPAYTKLAGKQPGDQCASSGVDPALTSTDYKASSSTVSCGSAANTVAPQGTATLRFAVKINEQ